MLELDPDKVTVSAIADRTLISRKTFYLYYNSIESLLSEEMQEILDRYFKENEETPNDLEYFAGHARRFFVFLANQDEYVCRLVCSNMRFGFGEKIFEWQMNRYEKAGNPFAWMGAEQELVLRFIRSTALDFFRNWVQTNRVVDVNVAADLLGNLTENGVRPYIKTSN